MAPHNPASLSTTRHNSAVKNFKKYYKLLGERKPV